MGKRGKFIVIEGTDCSGKDTQTKKSFSFLQSKGISCEPITFPRYETPTGNILKRYLGKEPYTQEFGPSDLVPPKLASVFYAEDRYAAASEMRKKMSEGITLLCDRYVESNMGHQGGKISDPLQRKEFIDWLEELEYGNFQLPRPDAVLFLYMPYEVGMELKKGRAGKADGHESNADHLRRAESAYLELADRFHWHKIECAPTRTLDSLRSIDDINREVVSHIEHILQL